MFLAEEEVVAGEDEVEAFGGGEGGLTLAEVAGVCEGGGGDGLTAPSHCIASSEPRRRMSNSRKG